MQQQQQGAGQNTQGVLRNGLQQTFAQRRSNHKPAHAAQRTPQTVHALIMPPPPAGATTAYLVDCRLLQLAEALLHGAQLAAEALLHGAQLAAEALVQLRQLRCQCFHLLLQRRLRAECIRVTAGRVNTSPASLRKKTGIAAGPARRCVACRHTFWHSSHSRCKPGDRKPELHWPAAQRAQHRSVSAPALQRPPAGRRRAGAPGQRLPRRAPPAPCACALPPSPVHPQAWALAKGMLRTAEEKCSSSAAQQYAA